MEPTPFIPHLTPPSGGNSPSAQTDRTSLLVVDGKTFVHHACALRGRQAVLRVHIVADDHIFDLARDDVRALGTACDMIADVGSFGAERSELPTDACDDYHDEELDQAAIVASAVPLTYERITADSFAKVMAYVRHGQSALAVDDNDVMDEDRAAAAVAPSHRHWPNKPVTRPIQHSAAITACLGADLIERPAQSDNALAIHLANAETDQSEGEGEGEAAEPANEEQDHDGHSHMENVGAGEDVAQDRKNGQCARDGSAGTRGKRATSPNASADASATERSRAKRQRFNISRDRDQRSCGPRYKTRQQVRAVVDAMLVAEYMQVPGMVNALAKVLADWMVGLTPAQIRAQFELSNDLDDGAIDELRYGLGWTTSREPSASTSNSIAAGSIAPCRETPVEGGWHDLPWPLQQQALRWYRSVAPDAHCVLAPFVCRAWRGAFRVPMPQAPLAVVEQLLATCPSCATLRWAFAEAGMHARWLTRDAVPAITRHPGRRALISWLQDRGLLEGHRQVVWMGLERDGTIDDMHWVAKDERWLLHCQNDGSMANSCNDLSKVKWMRERLLATAPKSAADPAYIFRRALAARNPHTAEWAWDELGVRELADPSCIDEDQANRNVVDARKQLDFGAQTGRMELIHEAVEHLRGHFSYYLAGVIKEAAAHRRMDMLEWAWKEYLAHPHASYPRRHWHAGTGQGSAEPKEEEKTIGALGKLAKILLFAAMKAEDWPELVDWVWARLDAQPLCAMALRCGFRNVLADRWIDTDKSFATIASWALRQTDLSALSHFHERIPFQASGLLWSAISSDRMDLVEWCAERSDPTRWNVMLMGFALSQKRFNLVRWFHARGVPYMVEPRCTGTTELCGYNDCSCHKYAVLTSAADSGDLAIVQWTVETLLQHGGIAACTAKMRSGLFSTAAFKGYLPLLEWLVDVARLDRASDISLIAERAAKAGRLNVLWWLAHERGWCIRVDNRQHQPPPRLGEEQQPALPREDPQQEEPAKEAREIVLRGIIAGQSAIAAQWLVNSGFWQGELPKSLTYRPHD